MRTETSPLKELVYGAFGGGKTRTVSMLAVLLSLSLCEKGYAGTRQLFGGAVAPTEKRQKLIVAGLAEVCRPEWYRFRKKESDWLFTPLGVTLEIRSSKEQSAETGTPIQGQNWSFAVVDELQDQTRAYPHIQVRGRSAPEGKYPIIATATAKDSMAWREFRDNLVGLHISRLEGRSNAFVWPSFWDELQKTLSARDYKRMVLALDVGPERAVYPAWERDKNIAVIPRIGAVDVTERILGNGWKMLGGHDPGVLRNATVLLKAYRLATEEFFRWYVVGEFVTDGTTTREHGEKCAQFVRSKWGLRLEPERPDISQVLVRNDPWSESEYGTHKSVYLELEKCGFAVKSAAYTKRAEGKGRVHLRASVEMLNGLMRSAGGRRRFFVAQGDDGRPVAPMLVRSIELSEWDRSGDREVGRKDDKDRDPTDLPSALRYALWSYERTRFEDTRAEASWRA